MGGGGVMRAAAKVAGIGVVNSGIRGFPGVPAVEHPVSAAARKATRPVSAIVSSSGEVNSTVAIASQNDNVDASVQRPFWEIDDWEFAGEEEELIVKASEPLPRVVFGGVPTIQEAKEATSELKDALEKVYLSSPRSTGSKDSYVSGQESALSLLSDSDVLDRRVYVTTENCATPTVSKNALQAFRFLHESPAAQNVVASIACDPNVWHAVMQNEALVDFLQTQKISASFSDLNPDGYKPAADADFQDPPSPKNFGPSSDTGSTTDSGNLFESFMQNVKHTVVEMMSSLSDYFQNLFGGPGSEKSVPEDGSERNTFIDKAVGAGFMGLAVMVVMVVALKRV